MDVRNANVLVTGGSRGIGEAMARKFAAAGANVAITARSGGDLERIAGEITGKAFTADLLDPNEVDSLIARVERDFAPIDILVNNAGLDTSDAFVRVDPAAIRNVARLNLEAPMLLTRHVLPGMLQRGCGHLVFVSSLAGSAGFPGLAAYSGTKAGVNNFVATLRLELRGYPVGTTLVAPGPVDTEMWQHLEDSAFEAPTLRRLRQLQLLPMAKPAKLAANVVDAVSKNRRHVRTPRRLSATFWLGESPRRMTELLLRGVDTRHD
jgi:short-subunit dehydrogenase